MNNTLSASLHLMLSVTGFLHLQFLLSQCLLHVLCYECLFHDCCSTTELDVGFSR